MRRLAAALALVLVLAVSLPSSAHAITKCAGGATAVSGGGTNPSVTGTDSCGVITVGTGVSVTSITLVFSQTFGANIHCVFTPSLAAVVPSYTPGTSSVAIALSLTLGGGTLAYVCFAP